MDEIFNLERDRIEFDQAKVKVADCYKQLIAMMGDQYRPAITYQFKRVIGELKSYYDHEPSVR